MAFLFIEVQIDSNHFCTDCDFVRHDQEDTPYCIIFHEQLTKNTFDETERCKQCKESEKKANLLHGKTNR